MDEAFKIVADAASRISSEQLISIVVIIGSGYIALNVVKKAASVVASAIGIMAVLYFFKPDLFYQAWDAIQSALSSVKFPLF